MAVTLTVQQLAYSLRLLADTTESVEEPIAGVLSGLLGSTSALVLQYAPRAPDAIHNEAATRLAGFLYDVPPGANRQSINPMRDCGAMSLLSSFRVQRATVLDDGGASLIPEGVGLNAEQVRDLIQQELAGLGGVTDAIARDRAGQAQNEIDAHESSQHNTDTVAREAAGQAQNEIAAHEADHPIEVVYLGAYNSLTAEEKANVDLGQYSLLNNRYWIVHLREQARENAPGSGVLDGWRPLDGQYRGLAPPQVRFYDAGDHTVINGSAYFCEVEGQYTSAQILVSSNWSGPASVDEVARQSAAANTLAFAAHVAKHPGSSSDTGRTEVLIPFRPGSNPTKIVIEATGYTENGNYTGYGVPRYITGDGGYTISVVDAHDFSGEQHIVDLLSGADASQPITAMPDAPTLAGLSGIFRDGNFVSTVSSRPSSIVSLHFIESSGGSRYWNPENRVASFPHGGSSTPDFNDGHQWIAGLAILAVGNEHRIELIADGDQPGGTLRVSLGAPGGASVEHLVVPLTTDTNTYQSGLVSDIPDGQNLEFSITNNGNVRILHDGLHFERFILEEEYQERLLPLQERIAALEEAMA